jgi:hypothetical protein
MVLQQGTKVNLWGEADPGEVVKVKLGGQETEATAGQRDTPGLPPAFTQAALAHSIRMLKDHVSSDCWAIVPS